MRCAEQFAGRQIKSDHGENGALLHCPPRKSKCDEAALLLNRGKIWIVLLGNTVEEGVAGFGGSVEAALRAFDAQYLRGLQPPGKACRSSFSEA